jgi:nucleotide-binding universal stress UspA family protein
MYHSILVPLDGSGFGEHSLPHALSIAERAGATLQLVRVHVPVAPLYGGNELAADVALDATVRDQEGNYLGRVLERLAAVAPVPATSVLLDGPVADAVHDQAVASRTDLVVMATHGRGPWSRLWLGSVADKLIRRLPMPVLLIRPEEGPTDLAARPVLKRVLVPLDGSDAAEQILEPAAELGLLMGAEFTLLLVIEPVIVPDRRLAGNAITGLDPALLRQVEAEARQYLERAAERLRARALPVQTEVVLNRPAPVAILDVARTRAVDLIALETHGRGGLARLVLGSVADKVLRGSSTAVLLHRPLTTHRKGP